MSYDPDDEPLKPTYKFRYPPWRSEFLHNYKGREQWWGDYKYEDLIFKDRKRRTQLYSVPEEDPRYYDPPVPDGQSMSGPLGKDRTWNTNLAHKGDQPGNFYEFQKKVMKNSLQYKQIAERWQLSDEHPGIEVNPTHGGIYYIPNDYLGRVFGFPSRFFHLGPRFFDQPMNEGCFTKGLALVKLAMFGTAGYTLFHIKAYPPKNMPYSWNINTIVRRYVKHLPGPCALSFVYGCGLCTISAIRNKDDVYNYYYLSLLGGATLTTMTQNTAFGVCLALTTAAVGTIFHYLRVHRYGIQAPANQQEVAGFHFGPLSWTKLNFGDVEIPKKVW